MYRGSSHEPKLGIPERLREKTWEYLINTADETAGGPDGSDGSGWSDGSEEPHVPEGDAPEQTVLCFKWGTAYPAAYVNVLARAVADHLGPHRFVCLTDDAAGLDPRVEARPLPELGLPSGMVARGGWPKLGVFDPGLGLTGKVLVLDVDLVVTGRLEPFFDAIGARATGARGTGSRGTGRKDAGRKDAGVVAMREPPKILERLRGVRHRGANTSAFGFVGGTEAQILDRFRADPAAALARHRIEQAHVTAEASSLAFWPDAADGTPLIVSFKYALNPPRPLRGRVAPRRPGPGTGLVAFHGHPNPTDLLDREWFEARGREGFDGRPGGGGYCTWVADYWQRYSRGLVS